MQIDIKYIMRWVIFLKDSSLPYLIKITAGLIPVDPQGESFIHMKS